MLRPVARFRALAFVVVLAWQAWPVEPVWASSPQASRPGLTIPVPAPGVIQRVELADGSVLYGRVTSVEGERVLFEPTVGGQVELRREAIVGIRAVKGSIVNGTFVASSGTPTRLFFAPTARPLARGEATFGVYEVLLPFVQLGVTDRFSIGGGTPLLFGGDGDRPFWVTPKLALYAREALHVSVGAIHVFGAEEGAGVAYAVATKGRPEGAVTLGVGFAYSGRSRSAVFMVGGEKAASRRIHLITENWFWKGGYGIISGGLRFQGEKLSADVGLAMPWDAADPEVILAPVVNFSYRF
jgi:hypothetical protein